MRGSAPLLHRSKGQQIPTLLRFCSTCDPIGKRFYCLGAGCDRCSHSSLDLLSGWSIDHFIRPGNLQGLLLMLVCWWSFTKWYPGDPCSDSIGGLDHAASTRCAATYSPRFRARSASLTAAKRGDLMSRLLNDVSGEPGFWTDDCSNAGQPVQPGGNYHCHALINLRLGQ